MKDLVVGYKESMSTGLCVPPSIAIGLTDEKIERIVANVEKIDSKLFLVNIIGIVENKTLNKILNIINMVLNFAFFSFELGRKRAKDSCS